MRLFFAVPIPAEISRDITAEGGKIICNSLRWVAPENQHFTLCFLGAVEEGRVAELILNGPKTALKHHSFLLTISGAGFFPDEERPKVFWVGAGAGAEKLIALAGDLSLTSEDRSFLPHLTVARIKAGEGLHPLTFQELNSWKTRNFGSFLVNEFCLMESLLSPTGAVYRTVHSFPLEALDGRQG
ncbi:MAG: RNA 2',3'-cyclic phosphodiesterase [Candidatus Omnitrophica bacterium]|nr:RNA 2',3'-cyclic phosphodiesterase [Candidatus Omnitrophota bacterium]